MVGWVGWWTGEWVCGWVRGMDVVVGGMGVMWYAGVGMGGDVVDGDGGCAGG